MDLCLRFPMSHVSFKHSIWDKELLQVLSAQSYNFSICLYKSRDGTPTTNCRSFCAENQREGKKLLDHNQRQCNLKTSHSSDQKFFSERHTPSAYLHWGHFQLAIPKTVSCPVKSLSHKSCKTSLTSTAMTLRLPRQHTASSNLGGLLGRTVLQGSWDPCKLWCFKEALAKEGNLLLMKKFYLLSTRATIYIVLEYTSLPAQESEEKGGHLRKVPSMKTLLPGATQLWLGQSKAEDRLTSACTRDWAPTKLPDVVPDLRCQI